MTSKLLVKPKKNNKKDKEIAEIMYQEGERDSRGNVPKRIKR